MKIQEVGEGLHPCLGYLLYPVTAATTEEEQEGTRRPSCFSWSQILNNLINLSSAFSVPSSRVDTSRGMAPRRARVPVHCFLRLE